MTELIQVNCNCPDENIALELANAIVELKLAACVNIVSNIKSVYRWQGKIERDIETQLQIKTSSELYDELEQHLIRLHPYDVAEVIAIPIVNGNQEYIDWLKGNLK
ncbi:MAG: divalent-cation tolerance protein CutA [Gammaproteobacteria bacterium]|nr:divalent-cation tolerance protein CutA [Gammaproteobacteria bacterium]